jgi:hypothetical protein
LIPFTNVWQPSSLKPQTTIDFPLLSTNSLATLEIALTFTAALEIAFLTI